MSASKTQPALIGGLFIGVLSALPVVNLGNCCCCLWVICGGAIAAWLLQQNDPAPVATGDAAMAGLLAGLVGAVVATVISVPLNLVTGPMMQGWVEEIVRGTPELPPEFRDAFEQARRGQGSAAVAVAAGFVWLLVSLVIYAIFAAAGGALGAVFFRKAPVRPDVPPPPFAPPPPTSPF